MPADIDAWRDIARRLACALEAVLDTEAAPGDTGWRLIPQDKIDDAEQVLRARLDLIGDD